MNNTESNSLLDRIVRAKQAEIKALGPDDVRIPEEIAPALSFRDALKREPGTAIRVIAECKKASPSMGLMRPEYDPGAIAGSYARLGAAACSVLTDGEFFQGHVDHLRAARPAGIPLLRKDFTLDVKQIKQARAIGADAILLIVRLLSPTQLSEFLSAAEELGMDALVEIHEEKELDVALESGARIIGINHRNLDTLAMDLSLTETLAPRIRSARPDAVVVAESGVESPEGRGRVDAFADAILIGTAFMQSSDIDASWRSIFG